MDGLFPPFVEPDGPVLDDGHVVQAFLGGEPAGHSGRLHIEGPTLLADREIPAAVRVADGVVLVRRDIPDENEAARPIIEQALRDGGLELLDRETPLAIPVALQIVGLRLSSWDLWGTDLDGAFAAMRQAAAGDCGLPWEI